MGQCAVDLYTFFSKSSFNIVEIDNRTFCGPIEINLKKIASLRILQCIFFFSSFCARLWFIYLLYGLLWGRCNKSDRLPNGFAFLSLSLFRFLSLYVFIYLFYVDCPILDSFNSFILHTLHLAHRQIGLNWNKFVFVREKKTVFLPLCSYFAHSKKYRIIVIIVYKYLCYIEIFYI